MKTVGIYGYGVCRSCGCTDSEACYHPDVGTCWWVNADHTLCSHCQDKKIFRDSRTIHGRLVEASRDTNA